ncbi:MAG: aldolase, partial [bacterium]
MALDTIKNLISVKDDTIQIANIPKMREAMDALIHRAVFEKDDEKRKGLLVLVKEIAKAGGVIPASIQSLYEEMG